MAEKPEITATDYAISEKDQNFFKLYMDQTIFSDQINKYTC